MNLIHFCPFSRGWRLRCECPKFPIWQWVMELHECYLLLEGLPEGFPLPKHQDLIDPGRLGDTPLKIRSEPAFLMVVVFARSPPSPASSSLAIPPRTPLMCRRNASLVLSICGPENIMHDMSCALRPFFLSLAAAVEVASNAFAVAPLASPGAALDLHSACLWPCLPH